MTQQLSPAYQLFPYESTVTSTHTSGFPMGGVPETRKAPSVEEVFGIFGTG